MPYTDLNDMYGQDTVARIGATQTFMDRDPVTTTPFFEAGVLVENNDISDFLSTTASFRTGQIVLPFWNDIDASVEPNYSNDVYTDIAVPRSIDMGMMTARLAYLNEGFGAMTLATEVRGEDPFERVAARINLFWRRQAERRLVATLGGIMAASEAKDYGMVAPAATIDMLGIIAALETMGDAYDEIGAFVMNSSAWFDLVRQGIATQQRNPQSGVTDKFVDGKPAIVNDAALGTAAAPVIAAVGRGAFAYGIANGRVPEEYERQASRGNGGGADTLWTRRNMVLHPLGFTFTSEVITGNGTETNPVSAGWSDLMNADNWDLVATRKQVPLAFLKVAA